MKINAKQTSDELTDNVFKWAGLVFEFVVIMYALTIGYDQAAPLFGLPQASPLEIGGGLLVIRAVVYQVKRLLGKL